MKVTDYNLKKQFAVEPAPANSTFKWVCAAFCPTTGDFVSRVAIGVAPYAGLETPKDMGSVTVTQGADIGGASKVCENWQWTETLSRYEKHVSRDHVVAGTRRSLVAEK